MADSQHRVWEAIAASFDRTRSRPWPHVESFVRSLPASSRVLDLMAGNGRHTKTLLDAGLRVVALDWSRPASQIIAQRMAGVDVLVADACALPLADASVDACIYIAGLHSIPTSEGRAASLRDLHRVVRPGGLAQITVWSRDAARFSDAGLPPGPADVMVPWKADGHDEPRFYHLYTSDELQREAQAAGWHIESVTSIAVASPTPDNLVILLRA